MLDPSRLTKTRLALAGLAAVTLLAAAHPPKAQAAACEVALGDGAGAAWNTRIFGTFGVVGDEAFHASSGLSIDADGAGPGTFSFYSNTDANACAVEGGGQELRYPTRVVDGFDVTPTLYVSPD